MPWGMNGYPAYDYDREEAERQLRKAEKAAKRLEVIQCGQGRLGEC